MSKEGPRCFVCGQPMGEQDSYYECEKDKIHVSKTLYSKRPEPRPDEVVIKEMPSRQVLADFVAGMCGNSNVVFNRLTGRFERKDKPYD